MKTKILLLFVLISFSSVWSQDKNFERKRAFEGRKPPRREMHHLRFAKDILSDRFVDEAKITPEQVKKLKSEFDVLDQRMYEIGEKIGTLSKKQAEIAVKVLTTPGSDPAEMLKITDEIGKLRTEQAKLSVKVLVVIRDTLEPEQCAKVVKIMKEEREKMHKRMEFMRNKMKNRREGQEGRENFRRGPNFENIPPPPQPEE